MPKPPNELLSFETGLGAAHMYGLYVNWASKFSTPITRLWVTTLFHTCRSVRGPAHSVRNGEMPVLDPTEASALVDSI